MGGSLQNDRELSEEEIAKAWGRAEERGRTGDEGEA